MLPTFVIGLREGLEAALVVGIIAAFLARQGRRDALRHVWVGVGAAAALCLAVGVALHLLERSLPQQAAGGARDGHRPARRRHGHLDDRVDAPQRPPLKGGLEAAAAAALDAGSARALVAMAFLAVLREGFETAVFLLSVFQSSTNAAAASSGAVLGIAVSLAIGYGIYRGGVRINLQRFFTATGAVLWSWPPGCS